MDRESLTKRHSSQQFNCTLLMIVIDRYYYYTVCINMCLNSLICILEGQNHTIMQCIYFTVNLFVTID